MASLQSRLAALITTIKTETKAIRTMVSGTNNGDTSGLSTASNNLVGAINEVLATAQGASVINDATATATTVYSSSKVDTLISDAIVAALEGEDLSDIAAAIAANAATHSNLATAAQLTALSAIVNNKANASDVYTQAELGDPDTDLVAVWTAA